MTSHSEFPILPCVVIDIRLRFYDRKNASFIEHFQFKISNKIKKLNGNIHLILNVQTAHHICFHTMV